MSTAKFTPGPMRPLSAVEVSANAAYRWREQYRDWQPWDTFADGTTKESVDEALNREAHTPEAIARIINEGWARPQCSCCERHVDAVVRMADPWGGETKRWDMCLQCIEHARTLLTGAAA